MNNWLTYTPRRQRIGALDRRVTLLTPLKSTTDLGGEVITWAPWVETWAAILPQNTLEKYEADRQTAFNTVDFVIRFRPNVHEEMIVLYDNKQYEILYQAEYLDNPKKHYLQIRAQYKEQPVDVEGVAPDPSVGTFLKLGFYQKNENFTGTDWTITAGTLMDSGVITEAEINQRLFVHRSGTRAQFPRDYTIEAGNVIRFVFKARNEPVWLHQFDKY